MATINGTNGNDTLNGTASADTINGLSGNDSIGGNSGDDSLYGGTENDFLAGEIGNDLLSGGEGIDRLYGGAGVDILDGGDGNDTLETYEALRSFDSSNDTFLGGAGDDQINVRSIGGNITADGGEGIDTVFLNYLKRSTSISFTVGANYRITLPGLLDVSNVERLVFDGSEFNDSVLGGGSGNDLLRGALGNDTLEGGAGNDYLLGQDGDDILEGKDGDDSLYGDNGSDILNGGNGNDSINTVDEDSLLGLYLRDSGDNILTGDAGDDAIEVVVVNGVNTIDGGTGIDSLSLLYNEYWQGGAINITVNADYRINAPGLLDVSNVENLDFRGTEFDDSVLGGGNGGDKLRGELGNDTLEGGAGIDILDGGDGNDVMRGGAGNDTYSVDNVNDVVVETANGGVDTVSALISYTLAGNVEKLTLAGSAAINGSGNDLANVILGNLASNELAGDKGNDKLNSAAGSDTVKGGEGADTLNSGNDNDTLNGGSGNDILTGGSGSDRFAYATSSAYTTSTFGQDTITDFTSGSDKIRLDLTTFSAITSAVGTGFSNAGDFAIVTTDADAQTSTAAIVYNSSDGNLFYNQNGSAAGLGTGSSFAKLNRNPSIVATDFQIQA